jgi:hypothetical protein
MGSSMTELPYSRIVISLTIGSRMRFMMGKTRFCLQARFVFRLVLSRISALQPN